MLTIKYESQFKKDYKKILKRGYDLKRFEKVIYLLTEEKKLPTEYKDHQSTGNYKDFRECHIQNDWLLVYKINQDELILCLTRTGTHSDIFY